METTVFKLRVFCGKAVRVMSGLGFLAAAFASGAVSIATEEVKQAPAKRPVTVPDGIAMTHLADPDYWVGEPSKGRVALFSPDGTKFVVSLKKGIIESDTNEYSLLLFQTAEAFKSPRPEVVVTMVTSSSRDGLHKVKWLADNETVVFLGERPEELTQIYKINSRTRHLEQITHHATSITDYEVSPDGETFLFKADPESGARPNAQRTYLRREVAITEQRLEDLLSWEFATPTGQEVFWQNGHNPPRRISFGTEYEHPGQLLLMSNGRFALVTVMGGDIPKSQATSSEALVDTVGGLSGRSARPTVCLKYDSMTQSVTPLIDVPIGSIGVIPAASGASVFLQAYLEDGNKDGKREKQDLEVDMTTGAVRKLSPGEWPKTTSATPPIEVTLEESLTVPGKIYVREMKTGQRSQLLDLNPQFRELDLGEVRTIEWNVAGIPVIGGLFLPKGYRPGSRYPLVIQTHGFHPERFAMDGMEDWHSAFAARAMAAKGIMVLQAFQLKDRDESYPKVREDKTFGETPMERFMKFAALAYDEAVAYLDREGEIDRTRVGIVGFSRTVCFVGHALTHTKYQFAAASLVDGIDCGYFQYLIYPHAAVELSELNGGQKPFGPGLQLWLKESPSFTLDRLTAPVKLLALTRKGILEQWEWYAALRGQGKPVDYTFLPEEDDNHLLTKPWECQLAQQGLIDWFVFWLKDEEDPDPTKQEQYLRWRELRKQQSALQPNANDRAQRN
jgi:dipeptidyl aminopeptidase/acylaminoacyl peptidase